MLNNIYAKIKKYIKENRKFLIIWAIILFLFYFQLPYVVYKPGGAINLNDRVKVTDGYSANGKLEMAYVSMVKGTIPALLVSYVIPNWDMVPTSDIKGNNETVEQMMKMEKIEMTSSINNATIVAYKKANKDITITNKINTVIYIYDEANTDLELGDQILSVEGETISDLKDLQSKVETYQDGDTITLHIKRNSEELDVKATLFSIEGHTKIGVMISTTYEYDLDPKLDFEAKSSEAGPSGGLMMSLAIYNALVSDDITHGKTIIGTGTIDTLGNVGEIDGVKYKLLGAEKKHAEIFLCPKENYEEAIKVKNDNNLQIEVVEVGTFDDAINYLNSLNS